MLQVAGTSARRRKLLSEIARLAEVAIFGTLSENLPHLRKPGLPLPERRAQAWSASECELPRGEG